MALMANGKKVTELAIGENEFVTNDYYYNAGGTINATGTSFYFNIDFNDINPNGCWVISVNYSYGSNTSQLFWGKNSELLRAIKAGMGVTATNGVDNQFFTVSLSKNSKGGINISSTYPSDNSSDAQEMTSITLRFY